MLTALTAKKAEIEAKSNEIQGYISSRAAAETELRLLVEQYDRLLNEIAAYAESVTSDAEKLESGGLPLKRDRTPAGPMPAPLELTSRPGDMPGTCECRWRPVRNASSYVAECATVATGPWDRFYAGTRASCSATNLVSGQMYYFRVAAIGAAGQGPWSEISDKRAS